MRHNQDYKHISPYKLPTLTVRVEIELSFLQEWIAVEQEDDVLFCPKTELAERSSGRGHLVINASEYVSRFFDLQEPTSVPSFFRHFGAPGMQLDDSHAEPRPTRDCVYWSELVEFREALLTASDTPLEKWSQFTSGSGYLPWVEIEGIPPVEIQLEHNSISGVSRFDTPWRQCVATIFFDRAQDIQWRHCAKPGCTEIFRRTSKHERIFCSDECSHYMAVRYSRGLAKPLSRGKRTTRKKRDL